MALCNLSTEIIIFTYTAVCISFPRLVICEGRFWRLSVAMVTYLLHNTSKTNLATCHCFPPNIGKPLRFSVVFCKRKVPEKPEFCMWLASTTWDRCTYISKMAAFLWYSLAVDGDRLRFFLVYKKPQCYCVIAQLWCINLPRLLHLLRQTKR